MGSPCRVVFVSDLNRNEDSLRTFPCGHVAIGSGLQTATGLGLDALVLGVTGRVLRIAPGHVFSVRIPQLIGEVALVTARGHVVDYLPPLTACGLRRKDKSEGIRGLLPFIYPSLLRDGVTLRVVCVFSHSIITKSSLGS